MQVHRFRDMVAVHLGGETVYLTQTEAEKLGRAIRLATRELKLKVPFSKSTVGTFECSLPDDANSSARKV